MKKKIILCGIISGVVGFIGGLIAGVRFGAKSGVMQAFRYDFEHPEIFKDEDKLYEES